MTVRNERRSVAASRLARSWAYRSAVLFRVLAAVRPIPFISRPPMNLRYVTLGGSAHLPMMEASLRSLAATWPRRPRIRVVLADDSSTEAAKKRFGFWPDLEVVSWRTAAAWAGERIGADLERFAEREPMGRKMAAVFQALDSGPTLYCDVDLLWFRPSPSVDRWLESGAPRLAMSTDMVAAYDARVVGTYFPELASPPFYCAGVLFGKGGVPDLSSVAVALRFAASGGVGVTEQTIFAALTREAGGERFPLSEIHLSDEDRFALSPTFPGQPWSARHYVGQVRHLIWRDVFEISSRVRRGGSL